MRVLVVGCGSIGSRRARILAEMGHEVEITDTDINQIKLLGSYLDNGPGGLLATWRDPMDAIANRSIDPGVPPAVDAAFICTPPGAHAPIAQECLTADVSIPALFIEKPLALDAGVAERLGVLAIRASYYDQTSGRATTMGACNLRFDHRVQANEDRIRDAHHAIFRMGQHARHWNPAHKPIRMALDSIHELDLALALRGPAEDVSGHSTDGEARIEVVHENGRTSYIHLDRATDPPERYIQFPDNSRLDLWPPDDDMYRREMEHFLSCVEEGRQTCNPLEQAAETLRWALKVCETEKEVVG